MGKLYKQTILYDGDSGEVLSDTVRSGSANGKGWVIMYTDKINELVAKCTSGATLRVFMLLAAGQQFEERGMVTTKKAVQEHLKIDKSTCLEAFKWLKENMVINECRINGCTEFMVNPLYITVGRDKKKRQAEWVRRFSGATVAVLPDAKLDKAVKRVKPKVKKLVAAGRSIEEI